MFSGEILGQVGNDVAGHGKRIGAKAFARSRHWVHAGRMIHKVGIETGLFNLIEIPRSDEIIRWEDQGKTVIEGDKDSEISRRFFDLAEMLLKAEEEE